jgi:hypothetical protein
MSEWDPEREKYEPERDYRRDYVNPGLGQGERTPGRRRSDYERGVWSIGGSPREAPPGETAMSGAHAGKGPRGYCRADVRLYDEVCDRMERDGDLDASDIEVTVKAGEVVLSGSVSDDAARDRAQCVATSCSGVHAVQNRLRVRSGG